MLWDKENLSQEIKENLQVITLKKPLSWFRIRPLIKNFVYIKSFINNINQKGFDKLYLYSVSNTHKYSKIIESNQLFDYIEKNSETVIKKIPILSNIPLLVESE